MRIKQSLLAQLFIFIFAALYSAYMVSKLPEIVPTHWNASGQVDSYGSKWINLLLMPGVILAMLVMTAGLPKLSPQKFEITPFEETYGYVMVLVSALMLSLHVVIVQTSAGAHIAIDTVMMAIIFAFFALMGNVLGKVKRNFYLGIRTPWTLADERVWHSTHRFAGKLWFYGGIIGIVLCLAGAPFWASIGFLLAISFIPVVKSYFDYRGLQHDPKN